MVTPSNGISVAAPGKVRKGMATERAPMLPPRVLQPLVGDVVTKEEERLAPILRRAQVRPCAPSRVLAAVGGPVGDGLRGLGGRRPPAYQES